MPEFAAESVFFGTAITLAAYEVGIFCKKKWKIGIFNPLLVAIVLVVGFLAVTGVPAEVYQSSARYVSFLLTPATVCLAIPLYEQLDLLKKNAVAIFAGVFAGVLTSVVLVLVFALVFGFDHSEYVTFLPKSITTAIGMGVSEQMGGNVSITVITIIITGVVGNILGEPVLKLFRIHNPIAKGIGLGSSAHAIGTAKAMELGEVEGAMSGLSIAVAGLMTVVMSAIFAAFL